MDVGTSRTSIELRIAGGTGPLALVVEGEVVASWPAGTSDDAAGTVAVTLDAGALDGVAPGLARVAVGPDRLGVRRRRDDLLDPGAR